MSVYDKLEKAKADILALDYRKNDEDFIKLKFVVHDALCALQPNDKIESVKHTMQGFQSAYNHFVGGKKDGFMIAKFEGQQRDVIKCIEEIQSLLTQISSGAESRPLARHRKTP